MHGRIKSDVSIDEKKSHIRTLTHALRPEPDGPWLGRRPSTGQHSVEGAGEAMQDAIACDTGRHHPKTGRCERHG
jgi:hypothetical protein